MTLRNEKLVRMAEQIAANFSYTDDQEVISDKVADHLQRFWDPRMRSAIIAYESDGAGDMSETVRMAVHKVRR